MTDLADGGLQFEDDMSVLRLTAGRCAAAVSRAVDQLVVGAVGTIGLFGTHGLTPTSCPAARRRCSLSTKLT